MSNKYIKLSANQQQFSSTLNNVDFTIPEGMTIDLSKSKLLVNVVASVTQPTAGANDDGVASVYELGMLVCDGALPAGGNVGGTAAMAPPTSAVLVKNCHMKASKAGLVESIRRVDALRSGLAQYTKDVDEKQSLHLNGLVGPCGADGCHSSPFVNYVKTGTRLSKQVLSHNVTIPLREIMDSCEATAYSTDKYGQTKLHLEMNFDKLQIVALNTTEAAGAAANSDANAFKSFTTQTSAQDGTTVTSAVSDRATNNPELDFPLYVGQRVRINATIAGGGAANFDRSITSISYSNTTGFSTINFASIGTINDTQTCVFNSVIPSPSVAAPTFTINDCQLELKMTDESPPDSLSYTTYSTEEDSFPNQTSKSKLYQLEPNADNVLVALTNGGLYPSNIPTSYRIRVDNKEYSNGDVVMAGPEHLDDVNKLFLNMDLELKDISERAFTPAKDHDATDNRDQQMALVGAPLPLTQNQKSFNLEIAAAAMTELILYKRMVKSL